jgi:hypothetical protein
LSTGRTDRAPACDRRKTYQTRRACVNHATGVLVSPRPALFSGTPPIRLTPISVGKEEERRIGDLQPRQRRPKRGRSCREVQRKRPLSPRHRRSAARRCPAPDTAT